MTQACVLGYGLEPDSQLMLAVKAGDVNQLERILQRHRKPVIHFLYRMVQNSAVAEELAQEVFLRVYRSRTTYEPTAKFTTWLYHIALRVGLNAVRDRRQQRREEPLTVRLASGLPREFADRQPSAEASLLTEAHRQKIRDAVAALPARQRAAVLMHKYQGLNYVEIAATMNCSVPAVKSILFRSYASLRETLAAGD
jgi:RNA polymerase sigma-70 factor (ECF subfamily)